METYNFIAKYNFESSYCNIVSKTHLYNEIYEYNITSKIGCDNIYAIIEAVKLTPLTYTFPDVDDTDFTEIIEILKNYLGLKLNLSISNITVEPVENSWILTPYLTIGNLQNYVYLSQNDSIFNLDLYPLLNYIFVSTSEFTPFAHKKSDEPESKLINLNGLYLLENKYEDVASDIRRIVEDWENSGTFIIQESQELKIFSQLWNIKRIDEGLYQSTEFDLQWILNSLLTVKSGNLPKYLVTGNWIFSYKHIDQNRAFITYSFYIYYIGLVLKNKSLLDYISQIVVNADLSISAFFGTYAEANGFKPNISYLQSASFDNYSDAIKTKILLDLENKGVISLIIPINGVYWLVWNNATTLESTAQISTVLSDSNDKIISKIISGEKIKYSNYYLNGIFATDVTSGIMKMEDLKDMNLGTNLQIIKGKLYYESNLELFYTGSQNSKTLTKLSDLWNKGSFLSNWGITVYTYLGILDSSSLKIPQIFLDLKHKKNFNTLPDLIASN